MPYNPGISYHGDVYLNRGIAGAGEGLAQALKNYQDRRSEDQFITGELESLVPAAKALAEQGLIDPALIDKASKVPELSLAQKRGTVSSLKFSLAQAQQEANRRQTKELKLTELAQDAEAEAGRRRMQELQLNATLLPAQRQEQQDQRLAGFNQEIADHQGIPEGIKLADQDFYKEALARHGLMTPEVALSLVEKQFQPQVMDMGNGVVMATTSKRSAIPVVKPAPAQKPPSVEKLLALRASLLKNKANLMTKAGSDAEFDAQINALDEMLTAGGVEIPNGLESKPTGAGSTKEELLPVISPTGQKGQMPASKLEEALKHGYRRAK